MKREHGHKPTAPNPLPVPSGPAPAARWRTRPLTPQDAQRLRALAHAALDEHLDPQLAKLQQTTRVTAEGLERQVRDCVQALGCSVLGRLLEAETWVDPAQDTARAACPTCGQMSPRARDAQDQPLSDTMTLQTLLGPVPWQAPLYSCPACRRFFSPGPRDS